MFFSFGVKCFQFILHPHQQPWILFIKKTLCYRHFYVIYILLCIFYCNRICFQFRTNPYTLIWITYVSIKLLFFSLCRIKFIFCSLYFLFEFLYTLYKSSSFCFFSLLSSIILWVFRILGLVQRVCHFCHLTRNITNAL